MRRMNRIAREIIMRRRRGDSRRGDYDYRDRRGDMDYDSEDYARGGRGGRRDRGDMRDRNDYGDYAQGVRGTGRYGIGGRDYYGDRARRDGHYYDDEEEDFARGGRGRDRRRDYRDYADDEEEFRLTTSDIKEWKKMLKNADGTLGEKFTKEEIESAAEKLGVDYDGYTEKEFCLAANILYSDFGKALKQYIPEEKEAVVYAKMAKAFLEDPDAPEGGEKLAIYYNCIAKQDEE